ncbi:hypothetical protein [Fluviicola sp.]|uniref:hypothetical protein n=1 Tax=Fluviicola sp. TaxID=1917219 RepID=UPI00282DF72C|nr:hypothetical protein [Fluviicola sp.]MDR0801346.1 hypothetical protein [Fluviicola sp.]
MKKITIIASLLILFTACKKVDIHPNTTINPESVVEASRSANPNENSGDDGGSSSLTTGTNSTADPNNPDPEGGGITHPSRTKDQKDNK